MGADLTRHHLIPRARHRKGKTQREYELEEMRGRIAMLCRACHRHCHVVLTEREMAEQYSTVEALRGHPEIQRFVEWIASKPPGYQPRSRR